MDWEFPLRAAWAKDLDACLGAWGLVATFAGVGLTVAVLAGGGGGGALDTNSQSFLSLLTIQTLTVMLTQS